MRDPDPRLGGLDAQSPRTAGAVEVYLQLSAPYLDLDTLRLRQHRYRRRRGVYAALALGLRHPLDPVGPALVLEDGVRPVTLYLDDYLLVTADLGGAGG